MVLNLHDIGLDTTKFRAHTHYTIPDHETAHGATYRVTSKETLSEFTRYRNNGHLVMSHYASNFQSADPLRVWPHHFDEGCYIPIQTRLGEVTRSISLGMAVPDSDYQDAYFYVTAWNKEAQQQDQLPDIDPPANWHTSGWTGQVLEIRHLVGLPPEEQAITTCRFFEAAIKNARQLAGWSYKY